MIKQKNLEKKVLIFFVLFKSLESQASGKKNVWFPDGLDFENLPEFWTRHDFLDTLGCFTKEPALVKAKHIIFSFNVAFIYTFWLLIAKSLSSLPKH